MHPCTYDNMFLAGVANTVVTNGAVDIAVVVTVDVVVLVVVVATDFAIVSVAVECINVYIYIHICREWNRVSFELESRWSLGGVQVEPR